MHQRSQEAFVITPWTNSFENARPLKLAGHALVRLTEHDPYTTLAEIANDLFECNQRRHVHERHSVQTNHQCARIGMCHRQRTFEVFHSTKEKRAVNRVHQSPLWHRDDTEPTELFENIVALELLHLDG